MVNGDKLIFHIEKYLESMQRSKLCFTKTEKEREGVLVISLGWINKYIFIKTSKDFSLTTSISG